MTRQLRLPEFLDRITGEHSTEGAPKHSWEQSSQQCEGDHPHLPTGEDSQVLQEDGGFGNVDEGDIQTIPCEHKLGVRGMQIQWSRPGITAYALCDFRGGEAAHGPRQNETEQNHPIIEPDRFDDEAPGCEPKQHDDTGQRGEGDGGYQSDPLKVRLSIRHLAHVEWKRTITDG